MLSPAVHSNMLHQARHAHNLLSDFLHIVNAMVEEVCHFVFDGFMLVCWSCAKHRHPFHHACQLQHCMTLGSKDRPKPWNVKNHAPHDKWLTYINVFLPLEGGISVWYRCHVSAFCLIVITDLSVIALSNVRILSAIYSKYMWHLLYKADCACKCQCFAC